MDPLLGRNMLIFFMIILTTGTDEAGTENNIR